MRTIFRHRWMRIVSMTFITLHLSLITSIAQTSLYEKNMQLGEMFKNSGNLLLAEKYFQAAIDNTENELELLSANLHWVDIMKFSQPVKAQRLNDHCEEPSRQMPDYRQIYLAMNGFISSGSFTAASGWRSPIRTTRKTTGTTLFPAEPSMNSFSGKP